MSTIIADVSTTPAGEAPLAHAASALTPRQRVKAIVAGSTGNLVEWYDFYAYAFTALYFAASFFPQADRTAQLLNTAGIYAIGFLARPVGGWFFGRYADRKGRRAAMLLSVLLMCGGSLAIAFRSPWTLTAIALYLLQVVLFVVIFVNGWKLSVVSLIQTTLYAVITLGAGVLLFGEVLSLKQALGLALAIAGVVLLSY